MSRWSTGESDVERLLSTGELQLVRGGAANGEHLLTRARTTFATAASVATSDPGSSYVLAYDAGRYALTALLAHQGLRPTSSGGHYAVEQTVRAQFGPGFQSFGALRRRRHEIEYPSQPGDEIDEDEARDALDEVLTLISAAERLVDQVGLFSNPG